MYSVCSQAVSRQNIWLSVLRLPFSHPINHNTPPFPLPAAPRDNNSDAGAEAVQRQALELRCRAWAADEDTGSDFEVDGKDNLDHDSDQPRLATTKGRKQMNARDVAAAKRAAIPCLRNLASFVSNQERHVDAEVVLVRQEKGVLRAATRLVLFYGAGWGVSVGS